MLWPAFRHCGRSRYFKVLQRVAACLGCMPHAIVRIQQGLSRRFVKLGVGDWGTKNYPLNNLSHFRFMPRIYIIILNITSFSSNFLKKSAGKDVFHCVNPLSFLEGRLRFS